MSTGTPRPVAPAKGKLGVLTVGLGAVATTFIAGVELIRRGQAKPIGSLTQMGTIRLGKRTEARSPLIKEFVPLAELKDLVFGAWDPVPDNAYQSCLHCGVLDKYEHVEPIKDFLQNITPMPAVFEQTSVKRLEGVAKSPVFSHLATTLHGLTTIRACRAEQVLIREFDLQQVRTWSVS